METNAAIVLARLDSSRLPNKALHKINGKPLIEYCIAPLLDNPMFIPILATSDRHIDDPLESIARKNGIKVFRGSLENIAQRVEECIKYYNISAFARINGDSPFVRKELLEDGFSLMERDHLDLVTNLVPRSFPYGISLEIIRS